MRAENVEIADLDRETVERHMGDLLAVAADVPGEYWEVEHFMLDLPEKWTLSFAAWRAGRIVGYAIVSRPELERVHLHHFMIAAEMRGCGIGSRMADELERRAVAAGCSRVTLKVATSNIWGMRFYERVGYARIHTDGDYALMGKWIDRALGE